VIKGFLELLVIFNECVQCFSVLLNIIDAINKLCKWFISRLVPFHHKLKLLFQLYLKLLELIWVLVQILSVLRIILREVKTHTKGIILLILRFLLLLFNLNLFLFLFIFLFFFFSFLFFSFFGSFFLHPGFLLYFPCNSKFQLGGLVYPSCMPHVCLIYASSTSIPVDQNPEIWIIPTGIAKARNINFPCSILRVSIMDFPCPRLFIEKIHLFRLGSKQFWRKSGITENAISKLLKSDKGNECSASPWFLWEYSTTLSVSKEKQQLLELGHLQSFHFIHIWISTFIFNSFVIILFIHLYFSCLL